jgi:hypothetical protein
MHGACCVTRFKGEGAGWWVVCCCCFFGVGDWGGVRACVVWGWDVGVAGLETELIWGSGTLFAIDLSDVVTCFCT